MFSGCRLITPLAYLTTLVATSIYVPLASFFLLIHARVVSGWAHRFVCIDFVLTQLCAPLAGMDAMDIDDAPPETRAQVQALPALPVPQVPVPPVLHVPASQVPVRIFAAVEALEVPNADGGRCMYCVY